MSRRRAISLVEMMVAIVLLGTVGSLTIHLLLTMFHANSRQQEDAAADFVLAQLRLSLRDDVHQARQAQVEGNRLVLTLPNAQQVVYTADAQYVDKERLQLQGDTPQITHRDRFSLPRGLGLHWREEIEGDAQWLIVELQPHDSSLPEARKKPRIRRDVHFQIRVGRATGATP